MTHIHLCLISDQLLPNLLPVLADRPDRVLMLVSEGMARRGLHQRFARILGQRGIMVEERSGVPDANLARIEEAAFEIAASLDQPELRITLNLTGGNKLMALAFHRVFVEQLGDRTTAIYTDTAHGCIEVIHQIHQIHPIRQPARALTELLDLDTALAAQGASIARKRSDSKDETAMLKHRAELTRRLARELSSSPFLGLLNALSHQALDQSGENLSEPLQHLNQPARGQLFNLLEHCARVNLVRLHEKTTIEFLDARAARYLCGGWLEDYAWICAHESQPLRFGCGVEINWDGSGRGALQNEFDLLAVHQNRLLVVECKTARFDADSPTGADPLYKLDSLADAAGGLFGTALMLSARPLSDELHRRAKRQRIVVLDGEKIVALGAWLKGWKEG